MLKYEIGEIMKKNNIFLLSLIVWLFLMVNSTQVFSQVGITIQNISDFDVLQGIQIIKGNTSVTGFSSYLIQFSTTSHPNDWFSIIESKNSILNDVLAEWDTTIISDGDYNLRLVVLFENGDLVINEINNIRIRNYTATETPTRTVQITNVITSTPTATLKSTVTSPTATMLPKNPAVFTGTNFNRSILFGAIIAIVLILPISIFQFIKQKRKY